MNIWHACLAAVVAIWLPALANADDDMNESGETLRVMTFNIRYNNPSDGENAWPHRRDWAAEIIASNADIAGLQEALSGQIDDLAKRLPGFDWYGVGRQDGKQDGEFNPIFFRADRFEVLDRGTFWLSETPETPGSKSWDSSLPRIASWLKLRDTSTGRNLLVANTHFDNRGRVAREESAKLLQRRLHDLADGLPVVLTGDFNTTALRAPYKWLTGSKASAAPADESLLVFRDSREVSDEPPAGPKSTWNGFRFIVPGRRIDFIFVAGPVGVESHRTLDEKRDGKFPSDHLPVVATLSVGE